MMMKLFLLHMVVLNMVITTAAMTTNNRILLSSVLVGTAMAASVSGSYDFSYTDLALLTTAVLVINFPRNQQPVQAVELCTVPGYTNDPLLGCYRLEVNSIVTREQAIQRCVSDGGRLLLINSEAEALALTALLDNKVIPGVFIQGSRTSVSTPWVGDDGNPLPYLPSSVVNQNVPGFDVLALRPDSADTFSFVGNTPAQRLIAYVCEI